MVTTSGKAALYNITAITQVDSTGLYKIFSNNKLDTTVLQELFGPYPT